MTIDVILYIALGICTVILAVWSAVVGAASSSRRTVHTAGFVILGLACTVLTLATGVRNYAAQKQSESEKEKLAATLASQSITLAQNTGALDQARLELAKTQGTVEALQLEQADFHAADESGMKSLDTKIVQGFAAEKPEGNRYRKMSTAELREEGLAMAKKLRSDAETAKANDLSTSLKLFNDYKNQQALPADYVNNLMESSRAFIANYQQCCRTFAKLLREEMLRREGMVPGFQETNYMDFTYEHANNPILVSEIAENLERLARSLPDKTK